MVSEGKEKPFFFDLFLLFFTRTHLSNVGSERVCRGSIMVQRSLSLETD
jgi:hypothetical protein